MPLTSELSALSAAVPVFQQKPKLSKDKITLKLDRAIKKSLSFRVLATIGTFAVTYAFTGNPFTSTGVATAQALTNTTIYFVHEKMWERELVNNSGKRKNSN
jgi:uncharacterized membrane protein